MNDFKARLLDERIDLENRIENLNSFLVKDRNDKTATLIDLDMLNLQLNAMSSYLMVLNLRIKDLDMNE